LAARPAGYPVVMVLAFAPIAGHHILAWIVVGVVAGALAGRLVEGGGFGLFGDIVVGLAGAVVGGVLLHALTHQGHASPSLLVEIVVALGGAVVVLMLARLLGGRRSRRRHHLL
jgi:uncharacterized membrane protein YeaQ/YmgE (transglycosylase-associated protein family)